MPAKIELRAVESALYSEIIVPSHQETGVKVVSRDQFNIALIKSDTARSSVTIRNLWDLFRFSSRSVINCTRTSATVDVDILQDLSDEYINKTYTYTHTGRRD